MIHSNVQSLAKASNSDMLLKKWNDIEKSSKALFIKKFFRLLIPFSEKNNFLVISNYLFKNKKELTEKDLPYIKKIYFIFAHIYPLPEAIPIHYEAIVKSAINGKSHLEKLPQFVFNKVASYLTQKDLLNLRSASDYLLQKTDVAILNEYRFGNISLIQIPKINHLKDIPAYLKKNPSHNLFVGKCELKSSTYRKIFKQFTFQKVHITLNQQIPFLKWQKDIKILEVSVNKYIPQTEADAIYNHKNLTELYLNNVRINLTPIRTLINLKILSIDEAFSLKNLQIFQPLTHLEKLFLNSTYELTCIEALKDLKQLQVLDIKICRNIDNFQAISHLPQLHSFSMGLTNLINLNLFKTPHLLTKLCLIKTTIIDYSRLIQFTHLQQLVVGNRFENFDLLSGLTDLRKLSLPNSQVTDLKSIINLKSLEILDIRNCQHITDFKPLEKLTLLRQVFFGFDCKINESVIASLFRALPYVQTDQSHLQSVYDSRPYLPYHINPLTQF